MKIEFDTKLQNEANERFAGEVLPKDIQPLILNIQPKAFTRVPRESLDFWKEYFFGGMKIDFDPGRFAENSTTSWCNDGADVNRHYWPCDCDAS